MANKKQKNKDLGSEILKNVRGDRRVVQLQIAELALALGKSEDISKHSVYGSIFAKYVETLQRSNEQLLKLAEFERKASEAQDSEDDDFDNESIYEELNEVVETTPKG